DFAEGNSLESARPLQAEAKSTDSGEKVEYSEFCCWVWLPGDHGLISIRQPSSRMVWMVSPRLRSLRRMAAQWTEIASMGFEGCFRSPQTRATMVAWATTLGMARDRTAATTACWGVRRTARPRKARAPVSRSTKTRFGSI